MKILVMVGAVIWCAYGYGMQEQEEVTFTKNAVAVNKAGDVIEQEEHREDEEPKQQETVKPEHKDTSASPAKITENSEQQLVPESVSQEVLRNLAHEDWYITWARKIFCCCRHRC